MKAILDQAWGPREIPDGSVSRCGRRRELRLKAFRDMTGKFGGEARKVRRAMARDRARREWKKMATDTSGIAQYKAALDMVVWPEG